MNDYCSKTKPSSLHYANHCVFLSHSIRRTIDVCVGGLEGLVISLLRRYMHAIILPYVKHEKKQKNSSPSLSSPDIPKRSDRALPRSGCPMSKVSVKAGLKQPPCSSGRQRGHRARLSRASPAKGFSVVCRQALNWMQSPKVNWGECLPKKPFISSRVTHISADKSLMPCESNGPGKRWRPSWEFQGLYGGRAGLSR